MDERTPLPALSEEQAAQVDRNLALSSDFLRDVLHHPEIVDEIPSGATLVFHTVQFRPEPVRLTAFRPRRDRRWGVRVTGVGAPEVPPSQRAAGRWLFSIRPLVQHATWASADEAFAAVEEALENARAARLLAG